MAGSPAWQEQDNSVRCCKLTLNGGGYFSKQLLLQETVNNGSFNNLDAFLANKKNKIIMLKTRRIIKDTQYSLMFPINGTPTNLEDWDITLVTLILTNYVTLNQGHKGAIQDVRRLRNTVHGHVVHLAMTETIFHTTWADISSTLTRISPLLTDQQCQTVIKDMIASIEHEVLSADKVMQTMKEWYESDKKVEEMLGELGKEITSVKQVVMNIEEKLKKDNAQIESRLTTVDDNIKSSLTREKFYHDDLRKRIGDEKQNMSLIQSQLTSMYDLMETFFKRNDDCHTSLKKELGDIGNRFNLMEKNQHNQSVDQMKLNRKLANAEYQIKAHMDELWKLDIGHETRLTQKAVNLLQSSNIVVIQGNPGVGKTHNAWNVLKVITDSVSNLKTLEFCDPSVNEVEEMIDTSDKYLLLFNDFLGRINIDKTKLSDWNRYITSLLPYIKCGKMFVVITIRTIIRNKCSNERVNIIFDKVWTLDLDEFTMNVEEKKIMLNNYAKHFDVDISKLDKDKVIKEPVYGVGFPLLCRVMKSKNVLNLFTRPVEVLKEDILCMPEKDNASFISLLMTMFYDTTFKSFVDHETKCFEQIKTYFGAKTLNEYMMWTAAHSLLQTYLRIKEDGCFTFVHDTILEATFKAAVAKLPYILIQYCPLKTIVTFSNAFTEDGTNMTYCMQYKMLLERFKKNLDKSEIKIIAGLSLWKQSEFIKVAIQVISPEMWYKEDDTNNSLIVYFAGYGYIDIIEKIDIEINEKPSLISINNKKTQKEKAMQEACLRGKNEIIKYLLKYHGTAITEESMFAAVKGGNVQVLEQLLDAGGNIRAQRNDTGENLIHEVCRQGHLSMARYILAKCEISMNLDLLVSETINKQLTPILYAALYSTFEMLKLMVDSGSDVMNKDKESQGCLHLAARNHEIVDLLQVFIYLINKGVDPKKPDIKNKTVLHMASLKGHFGVVEFLCNKYSILIKMMDNDNYTAAHYAVAPGGKLKCLVYLIEQGIDPLSRSSVGHTVLHLASGEGHLDVVEYLCSSFPSLIEMTDDENRTAAHYAAAGGHLKCFVNLIKQGIDPLSRSSVGQTVLHLASGEGHLDVVEYLCSSFPSLIEMTDDENRTAAHYAAAGGHLKCFVNLIKQGIDPLSRSSGGQTVLHLASGEGHLDVVKYLCSTYPSIIKMKQNDGYTAAYNAAAGGHLKCLVYLIEQGIDPMTRSSVGRTVLHLASGEGHLEVVNYLCSTYPSIIKMKLNAGYTAADVAAERGHLKCLVCLIEQGIDPLSKSSVGRTVLHLASGEGHLDVVEYLCSTYPSIIKMKLNYGYTAAYNAAAGGHLKCLVYLIQKGIHPLSRSSVGHTLLHMASGVGHLKVVEYLCSSFPSLIEMTDDENFTAAHIASAGGHLKCLDCLIKHGIDPLSRSSVGQTVLHIASGKGHLDVVEYLCSSFPSLIEMIDDENQTAAHNAAAGGHLNCLVCLIKQGIDPLSKSSVGQTVLHLASGEGHLEVVKYLCSSYPSIIKMKLNNGYTAAYNAAAGGHLKCLVCLIEQGIDPLSRSSVGQTVLYIASGVGHFKVVEYLCSSFPSLIEMIDDENLTTAHTAAARGHLKCLDYLIKQGIDPLSRSSGGQTVLHLASGEGHLEVVKYLCSSYPSIIKMKLNNGYTAAYNAAAGGHLKCLVCLIEQGIDPLSKSSVGQTVLHLASGEGHLEVVKYLCSSYPSIIKMKLNNGYTAAYNAAAGGHLKCLVCLIEQGIDPLSRSSVGQTVLHLASFKGQLKVVKYLCSTYPSIIEMIDDKNLTAAHTAASGGHLKCFVYLIDQGIDPLTRSSVSQTVLHIASGNGYLDVVEYLCSSYPSLIEMIDDETLTAAHNAAAGGHLKCLVYLIEQGIDPLSRTSVGQTVLHLSSGEGHLDVVEYLCSTYPSIIKMKQNDGYTAAYNAATRGQLKCLVYLIKQGVDPLLRSSVGQTVLHVASLEGHLDVVKYLCSTYPSIIKMKQNNGYTAAHYAAAGGHLKCFVYLIEQGIDPLSRSSVGQTVLHAASSEGHMEVVKYICSVYPSIIKMTSNSNMTAAYYAAVRGQFKCLVYLIDQGVDAMATDCNGRTVLHIASCNGHLEVVKYLCDKYSYLIEITDDYNYNAAHYAAKERHLKCLLYLIEQWG